MGILTQDELNPLQEARRVAEEHLSTIRDLYYTRLNTPTEKHNDEDEKPDGRQPCNLSKFFR